MARGIAVALGVLSLGLASFVWRVLGAEAGRLDALSPLSESDLRRLSVGERVLLTGTIAHDAPLLIHSLVVGCEEEEYDNDSHYVRRYAQPVPVSFGDGTLLVTLRQPCPRGDYTTLPNPDDATRRWVGYS